MREGGVRGGRKPSPETPPLISVGALAAESIIRLELCQRSRSLSRPSHTTCRGDPCGIILRPTAEGKIRPMPRYETRSCQFGLVSGIRQTSSDMVLVAE